MSIETTGAKALPKGFIHVPRSKGTALINTQHIVVVYPKEKGGCNIYFNNAELAVGTTLDYDSLLALIIKSQQ